MDNRPNIAAQEMGIAPDLGAGLNIQGKEMAPFRVTAAAAGARIEQTARDDWRPAQIPRFLRLIAPADLPILGVNGIDPPVGRGKKRLVTEAMERKRSLHKCINSDTPPDSPIHL